MRDKLKGKRIMVWTFMGNSRMYQALRDYGDRIDTIGLFSFKVDATGTITESGVAISNMLTYIEKWPHIRWLLTVANDGANSIFKAIRDNTDGAQDTFCSELIRIMEKYPWCNGVDIDLEKGDGYSTHEASTAMFKHIYETVKAYDSTKEMNICLPGMTSVNGSVGGENWCVYGDLDQYCDTASIMSYGMAWAGSAPGPVSPRSWLEGIYDYATQVMNPDKVFLGMPAYGWNWQIYRRTWVSITGVLPTPIMLRNTGCRVCITLRTMHLRNRLSLSFPIGMTTIWDRGHCLMCMTTWKAEMPFTRNIRRWQRCITADVI